MKLKIVFLVLLVCCIPQLACAYYVCHPCCSRFQLAGWWLSADYLLLFRRQRFFPPLVTTNPTSRPVLFAPGTTVLFGDKFISGKHRSGVRADLGLWWVPCLGFGGGGYNFGREKIRFNRRGNGVGSPILGRPFFNTVTNLQDVQLISFPTLTRFINGRIAIDSTNESWGFDFYFRYRFLNSRCWTFDLLAGYFSNRLQDDLNINTQTTSAPLAIPMTTTTVRESFHCRNNFYSGLIGFYTEWRSCNWGVTITGKVGLGKMVQKIDIEGTTTSQNLVTGVTTVSQGGLLAQPSNIGLHPSSIFSVVSQINTNLQLRLVGHLWCTAGYTYMFWPAVALAGRQVNLNINPTQVPGPVMGAPAPIFEKVNKSFWIQGFTAGFYICY